VDSFTANGAFVFPLQQAVEYQTLREISVANTEGKTLPRNLIGPNNTPSDTNGNLGD